MNAFSDHARQANRPPLSPDTALCAAYSSPFSTLSSQHPSTTSSSTSQVRPLTLHPPLHPPPPSHPPFTQHMAAPLPSPSATQPKPYFPQPLPPPTSDPSHPQPQQYLKQAPSSQATSQQASLQPQSHHQQPSAYDCPPQRGTANDPSAASPFLRDFNLVAEAAKRAQMAVLMRDMEGVAL